MPQWSHRVRPAARRRVERMKSRSACSSIARIRGDQTTLDVIEASEKPIALSHIGARSLWSTNRMAPDDVLKACGDKGGIIGIEAAPHTTITKAHPRHNLEAYMEHFEYIKDLVGIDHVGFGPDTLYGDHVGLHDTYKSSLSIKAASHQDNERVDYVEGRREPDGSVREHRPLARETRLLRRGYRPRSLAATHCVS